MIETQIAVQYKITHVNKFDTKFTTRQEFHSEQTPEETELVSMQTKQMFNMHTEGSCARVNTLLPSIGIQVPRNNTGVGRKNTVYK